MTTVQTHPSRAGARDRLLRVALKLDSAGSAAVGVVCLVGAGGLDTPLGAPTTMLAPLGAFLLAYAATLWFLATRRHISRPAAAVVIGGNAFWVAASVLLVIGDAVPLTTLGTASMIAQAVAVALVADLQILGLWRARPVAAV
jgi:hypothetical protein